MCKRVFTILTLHVCLTIIAVATASAQQQRRARPSGGLDNLSLPSTGMAISNGSWQRIAPAGAGFSVMMPGLPDEVSKELNSGAQITLRKFSVKTNDGEYLVGIVSNFPRELLQQPEFASRYFQYLPTAMIKSAENANKHYTLASQRALSLNEYPGRQFKFDSAEYTCIMRVYLTDERLYVVSIESQKGSASTEEADKFLNSFALAEN